MSEVKISEMTPDASVTGVELIPVSDAGSPKSVTITNIKDFTIDSIEAIAAATTAPLTDKAFILQSSAMKPVLLSTISQSILDSAWGKSDYTPAAGTDKMLLKTGSTEKTVTLTNLSEYIRSLIEATILDVSNLAPASSIAAADMFLLTVGTTGKKVLFSTLNSAIYAALNAYVTALTAVTASAGTDVFYCIQGGVEKKATLTQIKTALDFVTPPTSTTENKVPQWDSTSKKLKDGLELSTTIPEAASAVNTKLPTELAVRTLVDSAVSSVSELDIDGATDIGAALADADLLIVDDGASGTNRKSALSRVWTYVVGKAFGSTLPQAVGTAAAGSSDTAARLDHVHSALPYVAVDGTLATGANADFAPTKLVYNKTCSDSDGDDVIDLHDGTIIGQVLTVYLGTKSGSDGAVITPVTALSYATITLNTANQIATLQWQGATVGWAILYTNGTVA